MRRSFDEEIIPPVALEWDRFASRARRARNTQRGRLGSSPQMPRRKRAGLAGLLDTGDCRASALEEVPGPSRSLCPLMSVANREEPPDAARSMPWLQEPCAAPALGCSAKRCMTSRHKVRCWQAAEPSLRIGSPELRLPVHWKWNDR